MSRVAIIPARGGSKRIPRKNIKLFQGQPMIAYPIRAALLSGLFDRVIVSTDDEEIASVARELGAEVPFMRPAALADDHAGTVAVIQHALRELAATGDHPEYTCCLYATAPFVLPEKLREGFELLAARPDKDFAFTVSDYAAPVQRALRVNADGGVESLYPEYQQTRSQDLGARLPRRRTVLLGPGCRLGRGQGAARFAFPATGAAALPGPGHRQP